ncbi:MAG: cytochrome c maturation protein CcmE [Rickettsiales bacterium]|nr:cytochrome c maturation protein CcmE [Rickettsiales bacterium]
MKPKHTRLLFIVGSLLLMACAATLVLRTLGDTMVFFYTPTQLAQKIPQADFDATRTLRIGGLIKKDSVSNLKNGGIRFIITDLKYEVPVTFKGMVPSLFRDGQGVVAQGKLDKNGVMVAETILAKHDETYMPRAVVDALKASGRWQEGTAYGKPAP